MPKKRFFSLRWLLPMLAVLLAAGAAAGMGWRASRASPVETVVVTRGDVEARITATGTLQPRHFVDVGAQVSGLIRRLHVQPGDVVKKGQLLVEIDPSVQTAVVEAGRAGLADLDAQLAEQRALHRWAGLQFARQRQMAAEGATRDEDLQSAESAFDSAAARLRQIGARIEQTRATQRAEEVRLGYTRITAPMDGTIVSIEPREGQTLNATYQTPPVLRIADMSRMTVWAEVSEADVRGVKPGMTAYFTTLSDVGDLSHLPPRRWSGRVRQVLPAPPVAERAAGDDGAAAPTSRVVVYTALFDVDNADGELMPRMTAQVAFVVRSVQGVLTVPMSALSATRGERGLYQARVLQSDGEATARQVRIGVTDRVRGEVLEGLADGERVLSGEGP